MSNTFLTPQVVGREALMLLENELIAAQLFHRGHTAEFTGAKVGDAITVRAPATFVAQEFTSTISVQTATEAPTTIQLEKHFDVSFGVSSKEWTLSVEDFSRQLLQPAVAAIAQAIDYYILGKYVEIPYYVGTAADPPDALADLAAIDKVLNEQKVPMGGRIAILNPAAKADMLSITQVIQAEQRGDGGTALRNASLGRIFGIDWYMSQNVRSHTAGTLSDGATKTAKINSASVGLGDKTVAMDNTTLTGTLVIGDIFTVAGDTQKYVVTANASASGNAIASVSFSPGAKVAWADDAVVTFAPQANHAANIAGHPNGLTLAIVPLELPKGAAKAEYVGDRGLGLRVVFDYDSTYKKDTVSLDVLVGAKVQQPELLVRVLG
jgi:hypothetical protein